MRWSPHWPRPSSCGGEELANFLGRVGPEFRGYTYNLVIKYLVICHLSPFYFKLIHASFFKTVACQLKHVSRDMSFEFLTQLGGDELQEMLREAGMENSVHRFPTSLLPIPSSPGIASSRLLKVSKMRLCQTVACR